MEQPTLEEPSTEGDPAQAMAGIDVVVRSLPAGIKAIYWRSVFGARLALSVGLTLAHSAAIKHAALLIHASGVRSHFWS